jgi:hypothetical protein
MYFKQYNWRVIEINFIKVIYWTINKSNIHSFFSSLFLFFFTLLFGLDLSNSLSFLSPRTSKFLRVQNSSSSAWFSLRSYGLLFLLFVSIFYLFKDCESPSLFPIYICCRFKIFSSFISELPNLSISSI